MDNANVIRCRPGAALWFIVLIFGTLAGLTILLLALPNNGLRTVADYCAYVIFLGMCLTPTAALTYYLLRVQMIAATRGLRWREWGGWHEARWDEVTDYYEESIKQTKITVIVTTAGTARLGSGSTNLAALRDAVQRSTTNTVTRGWGERGKRAEEAWPYVFRYDTGGNLGLRWGAALLLIVAVLLLWMLLRGSVASFWSLGWLGLWSGMGMSFLGIFPFAVLTLILVLDALETRRRWTQRITASQNGLVYEDRKQRIASSWLEVADYYAPVAKRLDITRRQVVVTCAGVFDYTPRINDVRLLNTLIARFAPEAAARGKLEHPSSEDLLTGQFPQRRGQQVYHYRLRTNRALLWIPTVYLLLCAFPLLQARFYAWLNIPTKPITAVSVAIAAFGLCVTLFLWWVYHASGLRTNEEGITQYGPLIRKTIAWEDIHSYYRGEGFPSLSVISSSHARIYFWPIISNGEELRAEVARRAINSRTTDWETRKAAAQRDKPRR